MWTSRTPCARRKGWFTRCLFKLASVLHAGRPGCGRHARHGPARLRGELIFSLKTLLLIFPPALTGNMHLPRGETAAVPSERALAAARDTERGPSDRLPPRAGTGQAERGLAASVPRCQLLCSPVLMHHYFTPDKWFIWLSPPAPPLITPLIRSPAALSMPLSRQHECWKMDPAAFTCWRRQPGPEKRAVPNTARAC